MIVSRKPWSKVVPLFGYGIALAATGYFAWSAWHGDRGLMARQHYEQQIAERKAMIAALKDERDRWTRRSATLRSQQIDRDALEERALSVLNAGHENDVVVLLPGAAQ
jgi:cell division protein FtsB